MSNGIDTQALTSIFPALAAAAASNAAAGTGNGNSAGAGNDDKPKSKLWLNFGRMGITTNAQGEQVPTFLTDWGVPIDEDRLVKPLNGSGFKNQLTKLENEDRQELYSAFMTLQPGEERVVCADPTNGYMVVVRRIREEVSADSVAIAEQTRRPFSFSTVGQIPANPSNPAEAGVEAPVEA